MGVQRRSLGGLGGYLRRRTVPWSLQGRFPGFSGKFRVAIWHHFGAILCTCFNPKWGWTFDWFFCWFCIDFRSMFGIFLDAFLVVILYFVSNCENRKNCTAPRREHKNGGSEGSKVIPNCIQNRIKNAIKKSLMFYWFFVGFWGHFVGHFGCFLEPKIA